MRWRSASLVLRWLLPSRFNARETVIFDTPTRAATSAIVTCTAGSLRAAGFFGGGLTGDFAGGLRAGKVRVS